MEYFQLNNVTLCDWQTQRLGSSGSLALSPCLFHDLDRKFVPLGRTLKRYTSKYAILNTFCFWKKGSDYLDRVSVQLAIVSLKRWHYYTPPSVPYAFLMKSLTFEICLFKIDPDSRKSALTQKASHVACAEPSGSITCRSTGGATQKAMLSQQIHTLCETLHNCWAINYLQSI